MAYEFRLTVDPEQWREPKRLALTIPAGAHRMGRLVAADHDESMTTTVAAALYAFASLPDSERSEVYAEVHRLTGKGTLE